jgi:hypothetical protein
MLQFHFLHLLTLIPLQTTERIGGPWLGVIIPAALLLLSFGITWMLYKHFSQKI